MTTQATYDVLDALTADLDAAIEDAVSRIYDALEEGARALREEGEDDLADELEDTAASDVLTRGAVPDWLEEALEGHRQVLEALDAEEAA